MYNKKAISEALAKLNKAKAPKQEPDIIYSPRGQWDHPGEVTRVPSENITMQGVHTPLLGIDNMGNQQMMYPGAEYTFPGADYVDEYPFRDGGEFGDPPPKDINKRKLEIARQHYDFGKSITNKDSSLTQPVYPGDELYEKFWNPDIYSGLEGEVMREYRPDVIYVDPSNSTSTLFFTQYKRKYTPTPATPEPPIEVDKLPVRPYQSQLTDLRKIPQERQNLHREFNPYTGQHEVMSPQQVRQLERAKFKGEPQPQITPQPLDPVTRKPLEGYELFKYRTENDPTFKASFPTLNPSFEKGGEKDPPPRPILYVDPNDPAGRARYQAAQDSLTIYDAGKRAESYYKEAYPFLLDASSKGKTTEELRNIADALRKKHRLVPGSPEHNKFIKASDREESRHSTFLTEEKGEDITFPTSDGEYHYGFRTFNTYKPSQPVKYKPDPEIVAKQQQLIDAGFDIGKPDGIWGPKSKAAWAELQNKSNWRNNPKVPKEKPVVYTDDPNDPRIQAYIDKVRQIDEFIKYVERPDQDGASSRKNEKDWYLDPVHKIDWNLQPVKYREPVKEEPVKEDDSFIEETPTITLPKKEEPKGLTRQVPKTTTEWNPQLQMYVPVTRGGLDTVEDTGVDIGGRKLRYGGLTTGLTNTKGNLLMNNKGKRMMAQSGSLSATNELFLGNPLVTKRRRAVFVPGHDFQEGGAIELELTPEEIEQYKKGGYVVEELPKAQTGIKRPVSKKPLDYYLDGPKQSEVSDRAQVNLSVPTEQQTANTINYNKAVGEQAKAIKEAKPGISQKQAIQEAEFLIQNSRQPQAEIRQLDLEGQDKDRLFLDKAGDAQSFGDYSTTAWNVITNPIDAATAFMSPGGFGSNFNINQNAVEKLQRRGLLDRESWQDNAMMNVVSMLPYGVHGLGQVAALRDLYQSGEQLAYDPSLENAGWAALDLAGARMGVTPASNRLLRMQTKKALGNVADYVRPRAGLPGKSIPSKTIPSSSDYNINTFTPRQKQNAGILSDWLHDRRMPAEQLRNFSEGSADWNNLITDYVNVTGNTNAMREFLAGTGPLPSRYTVPNTPAAGTIDLRRPSNFGEVLQTLDMIKGQKKGPLKTVKNALTSLDKNLGAFLEKKLGNVKEPISMKDIENEVNTLLEKGVGVKKGDFKIKLEVLENGRTAVHLDIKDYLKKNKEQLKALFPGQNMDTYLERFPDGYIDSGIINAPATSTKTVSRTFSDIVTGKEQNKYFHSDNNLIKISTPGLRKVAEFPFDNWDSRIKNNILNNLGISGEYNKAINQALKNRGYGLYSGGSGHYEQGAKRYVRELLNNRVDVVNPENKSVQKFLEELKDSEKFTFLHERSLGDLLKDKDAVLPDNIQKYIQSAIFKYKKKGGAIDLELTDDEIKWYKSQGYNVEELQDGGEIISKHGWDYKKEGDKYFTKKVGDDKWIEPTGTALTAIQQKVFGDVEYTAEDKKLDYINNVQLLIDQGYTLNDLVKQRVGTKEGLLNLFPQLDDSTAAPVEAQPKQQEELVNRRFPITLGLADYNKPKTFSTDIESIKARAKKDALANVEKETAVSERPVEMPNIPTWRDIPAVDFSSRQPRSLQEIPNISRWQDFAPLINQNLSIPEYIEADLTEDEIKELKAEGHVIEEVKESFLDNLQNNVSKESVYNRGTNTFDPLGRKLKTPQSQQEIQDAANWYNQTAESKGLKEWKPESIRLRSFGETELGNAVSELGEEIEKYTGWAKRLGVKEGVIDPLDFDTEITETIDFKTPKKQTEDLAGDDLKPQGLKIHDVTSNKHLRYENEFDLSKGQKYLPIANVGNSNSKTQYNNVEGIAHFLLDADLTTGYQHPYAVNNVNQQLASPKPVMSPGSTVEEAYVPVYTNNADGTVKLTYKKHSELEESSFAPINTPAGTLLEGYTGLPYNIKSILRQYRFTDLDWEGKGTPGGVNNSFKNSIAGLNTVTGEATNLIYPNAKNGKKAYGKFGGASVVFIIPNANIAVDFAGSIEDIKNKGEELSEKYGIELNDLIVGFHDIGSFSAKPAANEKGELKFKQWADFNNEPYTGGGLAIIKE
jgi:hypothetical protein